jgi:hypothetical protein
MKDWASIIAQLRMKESEALDANALEFERFLDERGGRAKPVDARLVDDKYMQTERIVAQIRDEILDLSRQIAHDVPDPALRWWWARELYWNHPHRPELIGRYLLNCPPDQVPALVGQSTKGLQCGRCKATFFPRTREECKAAFLAAYKTGWERLCPACRKDIGPESRE